MVGADSRTTDRAALAKSVDASPHHGIRVHAEDTVSWERPYASGGGIRAAHMAVGDGGVTQGYIGTVHHYGEVSEGAPNVLIVPLNGGPSSSTLTWNNQIFAGPTMVGHRSDGHLPSEPALIENPQGLTTFADVLAADPMGTGASRMLPQHEAHRYHGVVSDNGTLSVVLQDTVERYGEQSPDIYLLGTSYAGGFRMVGVAANALEAGLPVKGLVLWAPVFDLGHAGYAARTPDAQRAYQGRNENFVAAASLAPMAAIAQHHGKLAEPCQSQNPFALYADGD